MSDLLEHDLREAFAERSALITGDASARLRAIDYHPRSRRLPSRPALGAVGLSGTAAALAVAFLLGSGATPAFAGWTPTPTAPVSGQLVAAEKHCGGGKPILSDTRGPYTASIYADGSTCLAGNGITINSSGGGGGQSVIPAGTIELRGAGESDSEGRALTMVDGRAGAGVTGVKIARSDGSEVQATVKNGWYLAWWPGTQRPVSAQVASTRADHPILPDHAGQFHSAVSSRRTLLERLRLRLRLRNTRQADDAADHRQTTAAGNNDSASGVGQPAPSRHTPQRLTQGKTASCGIRARTAVHSLRAQHRATFADQSPYRAITRCVVATPGG